MRYPTLVEELAGRRAIIVIGSGVSAGCNSHIDTSKKMPTWKELLNALSGAAHLTPEDKREYDELLLKDKFLEAAEIIESKMSSADISRVLSSLFISPKFIPSKWHQILTKFDLKIYITTNYDNLFETAISDAGSVDGFKFYSINENGLVSGLRSSSRLVIKAHGSLTSPDVKIILSKSGYFTAKKQFGTFYEILDALFLVNTVFFVGCGMSDPDFLLLMENSNIRVPHDCRHYALVPEGRHSAIREAMKFAYNLELIEYSIAADGSHDNGYDILAELLEQVEDLRIIPS
ncbi:SIR2 family protein [Geothrix terrae]|uniref:SIR2 family protein n=1 Tax=Geothrix terrae TaxID=2922720 RepID=UPI001FAB4ACC|nr:SIR2 family protein [Geothrix terrae]